MYNGDIVSVELCCDKEMTNAVIDKFGTDIQLVPQEDGEGFNVTVQVAVSPVFLSWVFMFGGQIKIVSPQSVASELVNMAEKFIKDGSEQ